MLEAKNLYEQSTGQVIDLERALEQAKNEIKIRGQSLSKQDWKNVEKQIKKRQEKYKVKLFYIEALKEQGISFDDNEFSQLFEKHYGKEVEESNVPFKTAVGISLVLCGLYLIWIPLPYCVAVGYGLIDTGVCVLGYEGLDAIDRWVHDK